MVNEPQTIETLALSLAAIQRLVTEQARTISALQATVARIDSKTPTTGTRVLQSAAIAVGARLLLKP